MLKDGVAVRVRLRKGSLLGAVETAFYRLEVVACQWLHDGVPADGVGVVLVKRPKSADGRAFETVVDSEAVRAVLDALVQFRTIGDRGGLQSLVEPV